MISPERKRACQHVRQRFFGIFGYSRSELPHLSHVPTSRSLKSGWRGNFITLCLWSEVAQVWISVPDPLNGSPLTLYCFHCSVLSNGIPPASQPAGSERLEQKVGRHIAQAGYGLTETTALGPGNGGPNYAAKPDSVGRPTAPLVAVKIVDEDGRWSSEGA